ncbi:MAG: hypothetical protein M0C28_39670 [Candidatus Moduliflexus flocculans]|nr:hypothetical protein [Candidatus Moduliflexus flocculans]
MREEFEKLAAAGKIEGRHIEPLVATDHQRLLHAPELGLWAHSRRWTRSSRGSRLISQTSRATRWTWRFAAEIARSRFPRTTSSPARPPTSRACAKWPRRNHLDLIKLVLQQLRRQGHGAIRSSRSLVPDVIRRRLEEVVGSGQARVEEGRSLSWCRSRRPSPSFTRTRKSPLQDRLMGEFRAAKGLKARIVVASEVLKNAHDLDRQAGGGR